MQYEFHITVQQKPDGLLLDVETWKKICEECIAKPLSIDLYHGKKLVGNQLMFSKNAEFFNDDSAYNYGVNLAYLINRSYPYDVARCKIERQLLANDTPSIDTDKYVENHIAVHTYSVLKLLPIVLEHKVHISKNVLNQPETGEWWFLTHRIFLGESSAIHDAAALVKQQLADESILIKKSEVEFVVYDSNPDIDNDWTNGVIAS